MIYPKNIENKIGFDEIRNILKEYCMSPLGKNKVDDITFSTKSDEISEWLEQIKEIRRITEEQIELPMNFLFDCRPALLRIKIENTHLEEDELFDIRRSLSTINNLVSFLNKTEDDEEKDNDGWKTDIKYPYPALHRLSEDILTYPGLIARIDQILDKFGHIRDTASQELAQIRRELARTESSISRTLNSILHSAQSEGVVEKDVTPTMRDGRLVIPVIPGLKRKIRGIVHDESATGKTVFIEPTEVVEANNKIRELESAERHEIIRILTEFTKNIRPHVKDLLLGYDFLAEMDLIRAKATMAINFKAFEPAIEVGPVIDWIRARHPILERTLKDKGAIVPLDIMLTSEKHILIISGPNAGGKSVCLKTVGLLQYMVQCGLSIPVGDRSKVGIFSDIMIDIGDEQSLENDLSTYSSHLLNMKNMMKQAGTASLILIDEFGTGTEPQIGGAIAEAVLDKLCKKGAWGVITTHYQNLKHFADSHDGISNGAMLYDRQEMKPLFQLAIGRPGSSFAIEIARKTGLPEEVIKEASDIVGSDYIQSDKYLQDIVRDKRYWEGKRQTIHQREKELETTVDRYKNRLEEIEQQRKEILGNAKKEAKELLAESNKKIENAIKEIREQQADKEETKRIRKELKEFEQETNAIDTKDNDDAIAKKIEQIKARKERKEKRKKEKEDKKLLSPTLSVTKVKETGPYKAKTGDAVRIKGTHTIGKIDNTDGKTAVVIFGDIKTKTAVNRLEPVDNNLYEKENNENTTEPTKAEQLAESLKSNAFSHITQNTVDDHRKEFHQDLDIRGLRGDEALNAVQHFIDDAILIGMSRVRILHGKGNGILRQLIRQYLSGIPNVTHYADEHVQFGGAGITVVDF